MFTANLIFKSNIMLKNILNLKGAHQLSKKEQLAINGGVLTCYNHCGGGCGTGEQCVEFICTEDDGTKTHEQVCMPNNGNQ
jgi:hypothetical protein